MLSPGALDRFKSHYLRGADPFDERASPIFGDLSGKENAVAATIVLMAFTGAFGILRQMSTIKLLVDEMDEKT